MALFFFSSRRRHTRWPRDWSSDVCSSDLYSLDRLGYDTEVNAFLGFLKRVCRHAHGQHLQIMFTIDGRRDLPERYLNRSEERRVGKECTSRVTPQYSRKLTESDALTNSIP